MIKKILKCFVADGLTDGQSDEQTHNVNAVSLRLCRGLKESCSTLKVSNRAFSVVMYTHPAVCKISKVNTTSNTP